LPRARSIQRSGTGLAVLLPLPATIEEYVMSAATIFEALREDHELQRALIRQLARTEGDSSTRRRLFETLKLELSAHAAAEERHFYLPLFESDLSQDKARHGVAEHHELEELVEELESIDMASSAWLKRARHLFERIEHHLAEEEHEFFPLAGKVLAEPSKARLAQDYRRETEQQRQSLASN